MSAREEKGRERKNKIIKYRKKKKKVHFGVRFRIVFFTSVVTACPDFFCRRSPRN